MSHIPISILAFLVAIAILIPFHEFGHFWVARLCGVKVLRFAVGFGKVWWSRRGRDGVEYCLCAIPLGGYVKMLDEREGAVAAEDLPYAFNRKNVWQRFLIVLAGPGFNLLLAVLLFVAVFRIGFEGPIPLLGEVSKGTPAELSGLQREDELVAVDGQPTPTVENVRQIWIHYVDAPVVMLTIKRAGHHEQVVLKQPPFDPNSHQDFFDTLGIHFAWPPILGDIVPDSPAMKAGLRPQDRVEEIDGKPVHSWADVITLVSAHPNASLPFHVLRDGKQIAVQVVPEARADGTGMIGAHMPHEMLRTGRYEWLASIKAAFDQTYRITALNIRFFADMVMGRASFDNIGGPVTIAYAAGASAEQGVVTYLNFLAVISIGLAVLNLLPIPMLDGGHLLFYMAEIVLRRPLSERVQEIGLRIGITILILLMLIAFYNDMMRWV